jgi:four helix bundle protein
MMGRITSFRDLEVYQNTYKACIEVMMKVIPKLPDFEKNDLKSQLRRSVKAIPRLIAEGYAKKHQKHGSRNIWMMLWVSATRPLSA